MDYKTSGVDIEAGYKSVELMKEYVKETMRAEVLGGPVSYTHLRAHETDSYLVCRLLLEKKKKKQKKRTK